MANPRWANVERHLVAYLTAQTGRTVITEATTQLEDLLPAHKITRVGGSTVATDPTGLTRLINVEVETITSRTQPRADLWDAVADIESAMYGLTASGTADWYVDEVTETFPAASIDDTNADDADGVRRASATYSLAVRPQPTTN